MKPEVICTQIVTTGADFNIVMACVLGMIACITVLAYLHPGIGHWIALHIAANAERMSAMRKAGMQARKDFLAANRQTQE